MHRHSMHIYVLHQLSCICFAPESFKGHAPASSLAARALGLWPESHGGVARRGVLAVRLLGRVPKGLESTEINLEAENTDL